MSKTKAQIAHRVGQEVGLIQVGQSLEASDLDRIEQGYNEVYDELKDSSLNFWSLNGSVPDKFVPYFVALICENVNATYSIPTKRYQRLLPMIQKARLKISELGSEDYETTSKPTYY